MNKIVKRILIVVFLSLSVMAVIYHELIMYGLAQGRGQLRIIWNAKPIDYFLEDPHFADSLKQKLHFIAEVRQYAIDSLGLENTKNYTTLYDQKGEDVMWVVTASKAFALEAKEWKFPVVGSVPYKGYFVQDKAQKLAQELIEAGWDADIRVPGGWSTLGWFKDPILSKMLQRSAGDLASLIIHEMVHATIFVKNDIDFNENLASFIGDLGAFHFLAYRYGDISPQYMQYEKEEIDYNKFVDHMLSGASKLEVLYGSFNEEVDLEMKLKLKSELINQIVNDLDTLSLSGKFKPSLIFKDKMPNNAYFMSFIRYRSKSKDFKHELDDQFQGDIKAIINHYKAKYPFL
jgi:predicted aminopeptidase